jgi:hypothetical protein
MIVSYLVYLSKAWRDVLPEQRERSGDLLAEATGKHVAALLNANRDQFPKLNSLKSSFVRLYYTPAADAEPWDWWNCIRLEINFDCQSIDPKQLQSMLLSRLPDKTHIEEIPVIPGDATSITGPT